MNDMIIVTCPHCKFTEEFPLYQSHFNAQHQKTFDCPSCEKKFIVNVQVLAEPTVEDIHTAMVTEFHEKFSLEINMYLNDSSRPMNETAFLYDIGKGLVSLSNEFYEQIARQKVEPHLRVNLKFFRAALILEETGELFIAMAMNNLLGVFDAILDLEYVTKGAALTFGITPAQITKGFAAVHASNMTKTRDSKNQKIQKGPNFIPVDLSVILGEK